MTHMPAARRPGLSLLEVIVALFVMALGMISLLTLFPLGAIQMGQALRDARAAETCSQGDTMMRLWWQQYVTDQANPTEPGYVALDGPGVLNPPYDNNPSFPVAIDPIGYQARSGQPTQFTLGTSIPRRSMFWITNDIYTAGFPPRAQNLQSALSFRTATMMDDITFNQVALPYDDSTITAVNPANLVKRQGRYNWAAIIQRPNNSVRNVANLKLLVFDGRPPGIATAGSEAVLTTVGIAPINSTQLSLNQNGAVDYLRAGNWIMDGTLGPTGIPNSNWYRIQSIDTSTPTWTVDLQTPLQTTVAANSSFYVFKNLIEVFDRPQLAPPDYKRQAP